jgi:hypothetical protein
MGAGFDEYSSWRFQVRGNEVTLDGKLEPDSVDRVLSLAALEFDANVLGVESQQPGQTAEEPTETAADPKATASQDYFKKVTNILKTCKDYKGGHPVGMAKWLRGRANQITELPVLNVDSELQGFGTKAATHLREVATDLQSASGRVTTERRRDSLNRYHFAGAPGEGRRTEITARARAGGADAFNKAADELYEQWAALRVTLTERYGVEF